MSARNMAAVLSFAACFLLVMPAQGQAVADNKIRIGLTEAPQPESKAWEDPARISAIIDPHGKDSLSAHINLELAKPLTGATADRQMALKGFVVWDRETGTDNRQNHLEIGGAFSSEFSTASLDRPPGSEDAALGRRLDFATRIEASYARTAQYSDVGSPTCIAVVESSRCRTEMKESARAGAAFAFFGPGFEDRPRKSDRSPGPLAYSVAPKIGIDYDHLINDPLDPDTGSEMSGGYLSGLAGIAVSIAPEFTSPRWEIDASAQLRQRIMASDSRRPSIKESALLVETSATYYVVRPTRPNGWRAGVGVTYSRGDDPLTGANNVNRIVLALRVGRY